MTRVLSIIGISLCAMAGVGTGWAEAQTASPSAPTFAKDVAPILYKNCITCHRPGQIAPMSLLSYDEARPWAKAIRDKTQNREMPPWSADPAVGKFRNDRRLTQQELDTLTAWVDAGAPKGDLSQMPPVPQFSDAWVYGPPDHIVDMPVDFTVPAEGEGPVLRLYSKLPFADDRYLSRVEMKPTNVAVVHHANVHFEALQIPPGAKLADGMFVDPNGKELQPEQLRKNASVFDLEEGQLISYVPGRGYEAYWPGVGKVLPAGQWLVWSVHYSPTGKSEQDRTRVGLYFAKEPLKHVVVTTQISGTYIVEGKEIPAGKAGGRPDIPVIPPYAENWKIAAIMPVQDDITVYGFQPHAHLRAKDWLYTVTYPDGREETLLSVPRYDFNWQLHYELAEPKKIPAGSRLVARSTFDNSLKNKYNPAPEKEVFWSEQSWDEMFQPKIEFSVDKLERKDVKNTQQQQ